MLSIFYCVATIQVATIQDVAINWYNMYMAYTYV